MTGGAAPRILTSALDKVNGQLHAQPRYFRGKNP